MRIWLNGNLLPESEARVSVYDSSLMFGDMVFEMTRTFNKIPFKFREHVDRLFASMRYLGIEIPYNPEELVIAHDDLLMANRKEMER